MGFNSGFKGLNIVEHIYINLKWNDCIMQHAQNRAMKMNLLGLIEIVLTLWFHNQQFANLYELF